MTRRGLCRCLFLAALCNGFLPLRADDQATPVTPPAAGAPARRPAKLALVLSGGGARGAAHVGVLKVLQELRVPVDLVVGTSMGAIAGGLYATGWSPESLERLLLETDFNQLFSDKVERVDKTFRRKQDDVTFFIPSKLRFKGWVPYLPVSLLRGQRMDLFFRTLEIQSTGLQDFDRFPIPFRAVATDIATGEAVVIDHGSLATSMRASMSVAGVFPPVEYEGRKLIDGGGSANLPVTIAQDLGAQSIIAVDITSSVEQGEPDSLSGIIDQMTIFITARNRAADLARLHPEDVLIQPQLGPIGFASFDKVRQGIAAGEAAARSVADKLKRFSVSEEEYARFKARLHTRDPRETIVERVILDNTSWVNDRVILRRLPYPTNQPLDRVKFQRDIMRLHGLDYFGVIRPELEAKEGVHEMTLHTPLKAYGRNSLQFGLSLRDDFAGESTYTFAMRHLLRAANRRGGEWE
ncbi:MAG TPA: patatin-like phospholipase family protein, partial [Candidatus Polarisedimenticolia bacterium]|nr:patatin-like phospholipase family protein [Candidatus Polarisedimenticolia bacterium]